jgi:hypothetical protein
VLAGKGVIAWRRTLAGLSPATPTRSTTPAPGVPEPVALPAGLAAGLVSALAALAMAAP